MKRIAELLSLSHDHHGALVLARRCRQSASAGVLATPDAAEAWRQVRDAWDWHLEPHFVLEESTLLPALEEAGEHALVARVHDDHRELRALASVEAPGAADVARFGELLEAHVRFEERELFEVAQEKLPPGRLAEIAEACRRTPREKPGKA